MRVRKVKPMSGYDPEALNEASENAEVPEGKATIIEINETVASEVYGDVDFDYDPTRKMIEVIADTGETEVTETFALPQSDASWFNPSFKLGNFRDKYGSVPKDGMEVETSVDEDTGFVGIDY